MTQQWDDLSFQALVEYLEDPLKGTDTARREAKNAIIHRFLDHEADVRLRLKAFQDRIAELEAALA